MSDERGHPREARPSMRDFDYFAERAAPADPQALLGQSDMPDELKVQAEELVQQRQRRGRFAVSTTLLWLMTFWFAWGYRDAAAYLMGRSRPPQQLGDVVGLRPGDVPHNSYVELEGITEHRGLAQKVIRTIGVVRQEYWYFRLVGSQGIFIEVPPDPQKYTFATQVKVAGRVVDPRRVSLYDTFIDDYHDRFHSQERPELRIVQVGVIPGEGRAPLAVLGLVLLGITALNTFAIWRYQRSRRRGPSGFVR